MYQHHTEPFGKYTKHIIADPAHGNSISLVPAFGACLLDLTLSGVSILDGYLTPNELEQNRWAKNTVLFPFPNRLADGQYEWEGQEYQFHINEPVTNTALHGFGMDKPMQAYQFHLKENRGAVSCRYSDPGEEECYPFPFTFFISFAISDPAGFEVEIRFRNDGQQALPVGLGWHPYFRLSERVEELRLHLPVCDMVGVDQRMIPTGKRYAYDEFQSLRSFGATVLDNCFALDPAPGRAELTLEGPKGRIRYWQETGPGKYNFIQLFTPPDRHALAIEPMTCNIDAFHNQQGLIRLEAGQEASARFGLSFEKA